MTLLENPGRKEVVVTFKPNRANTKRMRRDHDMKQKKEEKRSTKGLQGVGEPVLSFQDCTRETGTIISKCG